jgi:hypothetical protein
MRGVAKKAGCSPSRESLIPLSVLKRWEPVILLGVVALALACAATSAAGAAHYSRATFRPFTLRRSGIVIQMHPTEAPITVSTSSSGRLKACEYRGSWGSPFSKHWSHCLKLGPQPVRLPTSGGAIHVSFLVAPIASKATKVTTLVIRWHCVDHYFNVKPGATRLKAPPPTFDC